LTGFRIGQFTEQLIQDDVEAPMRRDNPTKLLNVSCL